MTGTQRQAQRPAAGRSAAPQLVWHPAGGAGDGPGGSAAVAEALDGMVADLRGLIEIADRKLAALRSADVERLRSCASDEARALQALLANRQKQDAILARAAQELQLPAGPRPRPEELAKKMSEPAASKIIAKTSGLRDAALELARKNALAGDVARRLQMHIRAVFEDVARAARETVGYGPTGQQQQATTRAWVDAVG